MRYLYNYVRALTGSFLLKGIDSMRGIIFRIIVNQINKRISDSEKQIRVVENLLNEARQCQNALYENDLLISLHHHEEVRNLCTNLLYVFM